MNERRVGKPDEDHIKKFKTLTSVGMVASEFIRDLYEPAITGLSKLMFSLFRGLSIYKEMLWAFQGNQS